MEDGIRWGEGGGGCDFGGADRYWGDLSVVGFTVVLLLSPPQVKHEKKDDIEFYYKME